jgi:hypothetical protein
MLCDINELILDHRSTINWDEIDEICSNAELRNEVITALTYTCVLLKTPIPPSFLNKELLNKNFITLDSLLEVKQKTVSRFYYCLKSLDKMTDRLVFVFRTFIPVKEWINNEYNTKSNKELIIAYFKYWFHLFMRHALKKDIRFGN